MELLLKSENDNVKIGSYRKWVNMFLNFVSTAGNFD